MDTCPFCQPGIIPHVFAETNNFWAVYNRAPILPGHSLILPKKHYESFFELDAAERLELIEFIDSTGRMLLHHFKGKGFNLALQDGWVAGQTVVHLHFHLMVRYEQDLPEPGSWYRALFLDELEPAGEAERTVLSVSDMHEMVTLLRGLTGFRK